MAVENTSGAGCKFCGSVDVTLETDEVTLSLRQLPSGQIETALHVEADFAEILCGNCNEKDDEPHEHPLMDALMNLSGARKFTEFVIES